MDRHVPYFRFDRDRFNTHAPLTISTGLPDRRRGVGVRSTNDFAARRGVGVQTVSPSLRLLGSDELIASE